MLCTTNYPLAQGEQLSTHTQTYTNVDTNSKNNDQDVQYTCKTLICTVAFLSGLPQNKKVFMMILRGAFIPRLNGLLIYVKKAIEG